MNTLRCAQEIPRDYPLTEDLVTYITENLLKELMGGLTTVIDSESAYIIKLEGVKTKDIPELYNVQYRQDLKIQRFVLCKDCKKRKPNKFCLEHKRYEEDYGYCSYAEPKEIDNK